MVSRNWEADKLTVVCRSDNDLFAVLTSNGYPCRRLDSAQQAVSAAEPETGLLILADDYPHKTLEIPAALLDAAEKKGLRLYVEFASIIGARCVEAIEKLKRERAVISSECFGPELPPMTLLALHDCHFVPMQADRADMVGAVVAGFNEAVFGLPEKRLPLLFKESLSLWVAATKLSHFVTARYGPQSAIKTMWEQIIFWASRGFCRPNLQWMPAVRPMFNRDVPLPPGFEKTALERGVEWHYKSRLLVHPKHYEFCMTDDIERPQPLPPDDLPNGDGRCGLSEGFSSYIFHDGSQRQRVGFRVDSLTETAMAVAFGWRVGRRPKDRELAANLLDFVYNLSGIQGGKMADPTHPSFGLCSWFLQTHPGHAPGDCEYLASDNRLLLASVAASVLLESDQWDEQILRAILAVERVTGPKGFGDRMSTSALEKHGWRYYSELDYPWQQWSHHDTASRFLMAYKLTGYEPLLIKGKTAIRCLMERFPEDLFWWSTVMTSNFILSLAWLVRLEDTREHRAWLYRAVNSLLVLQQPCGAIREDMGAPGRGTVSGNGPCQSNEDYATRETVLIQKNGEPLTDILYCDSIALVELHEAYMATGDAYIKEAVDRLAEFLCRVQIRTDRYPYLDGGWYRSFDYDKWEFWGSNCDVGWSSWSIETGWSQAWTLTGLGLRQLNASLWDICTSRPLHHLMPKVQAQMRMNDGGPWHSKETT